VTERRKIRIRGLVQGVGFRPHVYRQALEHGIAGVALNDGEGVLIEAEGEAVDDFLAAVRTLAPPLARIDSVVVAEQAVQGEASFRIGETQVGGSGEAASAAIPADVALCDACLAELFDPGNRRHLHPFIACTDCGPRITMTRTLPYDRDGTTMGDFELCSSCEREYEDPLTRRFHAEPIACHDCGPRLSQPIERVAEVIGTGGIVALKGIGGYHLVCDARSTESVDTLRERKQRDQKPFAVMVLNSASARQHAQVSEAAQTALESPQRPVVVIPRRQSSGGDGLPDALGPGLDSLGLMLPYTGVHYLLFHRLLGAPDGSDWLNQAQVPALVMTSANLSGKPLVSDPEAAEAELSGIADLLVHHDRVIARPTDDSVVRALAQACVPIRRARGSVPNAITLGGEASAVVACGAHLKNTVTVTRGDLAYTSTHVGDLENGDCIQFQREVLEQLLDMLGVRPRHVACDWHPDFASTRLAESLAHRFGAQLHRVQHHHAHIAALLAEHDHSGPVLGVALDGHGLGADGQAWGGELLRVDEQGFQRLGHFRPLQAVGGDRAAREPWRLAAGVLADLGLGETIESRFGHHALAGPLAELLRESGAPVTSAAGRLFDAASALLGVCEQASFEGQAPMLLEARVRRPFVLDDGFRLEEGVLDFRPLLGWLAETQDVQLGAEGFHGTLVAAITAWVKQASRETGLRTVALGGGCMINRVLASRLPDTLGEAGLEVLTARRIPPNDAAISLGQAWVASRPAVDTLSNEPGGERRHTTPA
jgi:hydrogenase maturation protein HypF